MNLFLDAVSLLKKLISTQSFSREEQATFEILKDFFHEKGIKTQEIKNNLWAFNQHFDASKPTILLNSHHDTVKPNQGYTKNPFEPIEENGKLYGLGSNDAGGCLVSLVAAFLHFYDNENLKFNLCVLCTAEEEISGADGMELVKKELPTIDFAIVGEPTLLDAAISEKGLIVVDCYAKGVAGHAAREEGENALYKALDDLIWIKNFEFPKISPTLGKVKMSATVIEAGKQHNVVPDLCHFVLDIRVTDAYSNEEIVEILKQNLQSEVVARSLRLKSSSIAKNHPIVLAAISTGSKVYGSPTLSDQALLDVPSLKMGPGDSARSHTADEFIYLNEIEKGIQKYIGCLSFLIESEK
jgi:acetylornithine deacetylase